MEVETKENSYIPERLEEDDEFEDFEEQGMTLSQPLLWRLFITIDYAKNVNVELDPIQWEDNWDDEQIDDDFCAQLRKELKQ